jgi:hypothetical protein
VDEVPPLPTFVQVPETLLCHWKVPAQPAATLAVSVLPVPRVPETTQRVEPPARAASAVALIAAMLSFASRSNVTMSVSSASVVAPPPSTGE